MNRLGQEGEDLAVTYLERAGYSILGRNVRLSGGELDAVARDGEVVVFVEVKTRSGSRFGPPQEAVDLAKQRRLTRLAQEWLQVHGLSESRARFDVVSIMIENRGKPLLRIFKNAFEAVS